VLRNQIINMWGLFYFLKYIQKRIAKMSIDKVTFEIFPRLFIIFLSTLLVLNNILGGINFGSKQKKNLGFINMKVFLGESAVLLI
jgi:hypothetical protein